MRTDGRDVDDHATAGTYDLIGNLYSGLGGPDGRTAFLYGIGRECISVWEVDFRSTGYRMFGPQRGLVEFESRGITTASGNA